MASAELSAIRAMPGQELGHVTLGNWRGRRQRTYPPYLYRPVIASGSIGVLEVWLPWFWVCLTCIGR
jgi:hypothetical protein